MDIQGSCSGCFFFYCRKVSKDRGKPQVTKMLKDPAETSCTDTWAASGHPRDVQAAVTAGALADPSRGQQGRERGEDQGKALTSS